MRLTIHDWTIFVVNKWNKQTYSRVTEQIRSLKFFMIFYVKDLRCKWSYMHLIYLLPCRICKFQYVGKSETTFNIRLNNHRKDATSEESILACKHFNECNHNFHVVEFTLIKQTERQPTTEETRKFMKHENTSGFQN